MLQSLLQKIVLILLFSLIFLSWYSPRLTPVLASPSTSVEYLPESNSTFPTLAQFRSEVRNESAGAPTGVYVSQVLAAAIVQQPRGNAAYVSTDPDSITQFSLAAAYRTVGLLAHNYLLGESFSNLKAGQKVALVYGDGKVKYYSISKIERFQALNPTSPYSSFRDPENTSVTLSVDQMFRKIYGPGDRLVFQTCIARDGNESWGRLFVTAEPLRKNINRSWFQLFAME